MHVPERCFPLSLRPRETAKSTRPFRPSSSGPGAFDFKIKRPKGSRGKIVTDWLWPDQAFRIFKAAQTLDEEFEILLEFLCYTGCRLSDPLKMKCSDVRLSEAFAFVGKTKNGKPRPIFLPPVLVARLACHPRGIDRGDERLFRFHKGGARTIC